MEFVLLISQADYVIDDHFKKFEMHGFNRENAWDIAAISAFFLPCPSALLILSILFPKKNDVKDIRSESAAPKV